MKNFLFLLLLSIQFGFSQTTLEKAEKLYADNKLLEAKEMFSSYLASNPNQPKCIEYLGDIAGKLEQWDEAIKQYDALKTLFPKMLIIIIN
ncbi:hypothetical protein [uncultured Flavobacterium sp.]|uniref:hypothetical protein n=1 Tax=uncultured Flavobacterium sp. TaxID=165435 RepID=UPI0030CA25EA